MSEEAQAAGLAFLVLVGAFIVGVATVVGLLLKLPRCPKCSEALRDVKVRPLDDSMPPGARWYCPHHGGPHYFTELPAAKGPEVREL